MNIFAQLPSEIMRLIFDYLTQNEKLDMMRVDKHLRVSLLKFYKIAYIRTKVFQTNFVIKTDSIFWTELIPGNIDIS